MTLFMKPDDKSTGMNQVSQDEGHFSWFRYREDGNPEPGKELGVERAAQVGTAATNPLF
jgi:hypothetical protein